ncbi:MAG: hypothetical protein FJY80_04330 [Candidatus Aminicenantes bacterium]|nr:hypothetical protein [Candidatus Aminicenantes bacterium]
MRKAHPLRKRARDFGGEYVLGMRDLKTHACYLIYGELAPGETGRRVSPGEGHEEILLAVTGDVTLVEGTEASVLREGEAVHFAGEETVLLSNPGRETCVYVLAGGHSSGGHS